MGRATVYRVTTRVDRLNVPGGDVWAYTRRLVREVEALAVTTAPFDQGDLSASHATAVTPLGEIGCTGTVRNTARHAKWVHEGTGVYGPTGSPITAGGEYMAFFTKDGRKIVTRSVLGQQGQPWLRDALNAVMLLHF